MITLLGLPWDRSSSFETGAAAGPAAIRAALWHESSNTWNEQGHDLGAPGALRDAGDVSVGEDPAGAREAIERAVSGLLEAGERPILLGGDHSVTYPVLRAVAARHEGLTVVHVDAHGDLYDQFPPGPPGTGDRYSHACPFARVMEDGLAARLIQVGVRTLSGHQREQAARFGVEVYGLAQLADAPLRALRGPIYVSLDLDGLDPAFAPGVSHPEPGGLSTAEVVRLLHTLPAGAVVGADVVELNPRRDIRDLTARVGAKLVKEVYGRMLAP
ncbi:MAG: agmatinase [Vicinamibacterales bacterium]